MSHRGRTPPADRKKVICRLCRSADTEVFLPLGDLPLANAFLTESDLDRPEPAYPLDLAVCHECTGVQLVETVPPERMFGNYLYRSSTSQTMLDHARQMAAGLVAERHLGADSLVVELGSNDGYLLRFFREAGVRVMGIDPAENLARQATEEGIETLAAFFGEEVAGGLRDQGIRADLIVANNVLAHVPDPHGFVAGIRLLLAADGAAVIEVPYLKEMVDRREYDTIYHEHVFYYSVTALHRLFCRHGLTLFDVQRYPIHGGSLRLYVGHEDAVTPGDAVRRHLDDEEEWARDPATYRAFADGLAEQRDKLRTLLRELRDAGHHIAAYGAAAKGTMLTNLCSIGADVIDFVADRNPDKQGRFMPGSHVPIVAPERFDTDAPDYCLVLVWNLLNEVVRQQRAWHEHGGRFIVPVPEPRVL